VASPGKQMLDSDRVLMKANLMLSKTIRKDYEHGDEIKYIDDVNKEVISI